MNTIEHFQALQNYSDFSPTAMDPKGLYDEGIENHKVVISQNRDSDVLARSNWDEAIFRLPENGETIQIRRVGHWSCGWFELLLVASDSPIEIQQIAGEIICNLAEYPVLNDELFSDMEMEEANEVWSNCFNNKDRIEYVRTAKENGEMEFNSFADMLAVCKGKYFNGYASELLA